MKVREDFERIADRLKALADPGRLQMLDYLFQGEATVSTLSQVSGQQITMTSHHLSVLLKANLVTSRREGRFVYYALHPSVSSWQDGKLVRRINLVDCRVEFVPSEVAGSWPIPTEPRPD